MSQSFKPVTRDDLEGALISVPGDGRRLLMCLYQTEHDAGADGITIVAMADDLDTLLERVLEAGLEMRP